ncbi:glycine receptor subunit alpha-2-like protein, partial [Leptotrombidium deliense]
DYETDLYLRQDWVDNRLKTPNFSKPLDLNDPTLVKMIWKPEVFFPNAKHAEFQYVTVPNVLVRIYPEGDILYMLRLKLRFSCMMDLYRYPMDAQICSMELASCKLIIKLLPELFDQSMIFSINEGHFIRSEHFSMKHLRSFYFYV